MGNKEYLNVNELATLFGLKVQTLHYYDKIGILKPSYRDPNNGYRKYRFDQTYKLASIRYMRKAWIFYRSSPGFSGHQRS